MDRFALLKNTIDKLFIIGNYDIAVSVFSESYTAHAGDKTYTGQAFVRQFAQQIRNAIPNIRIRRIELLPETDRVLSWQKSFTGIHKASLMEIPASGKKVKWHEISVTRFDGDKIAEEWVISDLAFQLMLKNK